MTPFALLFVTLVSATAVAANTYTSRGPFSFSQLRWKHDVPSLQDNGKPHLLHFTITVPTLDKNGDTPGVSCPVVFFYPGFEMLASFYKDYATHLASWGYVVVQYDVPLLPILTDKTHVAFFPYILKWISNELMTFQLPITVNFESLAVAGHSRGGKLSSLIALENPIVKALFLVDPVDGDKHHPGESEDFPSAVKALAGRNLKMAIEGSSVSGSCNPVDYDFHHFWNVAGDGSWLSVVRQAGHCQFLSAPPGRQWILNRLCKKGRTTSKAVIADTFPSLVAWFDDVFHKEQAEQIKGNGMSRMDEFFLWIESEVVSGELKFYVKGEEVIEI